MEFIPQKPAQRKERPRGSDALHRSGIANVPLPRPPLVPQPQQFDILRRTGLANLPLPQPFQQQQQQFDILRQAGISEMPLLRSQRQQQFDILRATGLANIPLPRPARQQANIRQQPLWAKIPLPSQKPGARQQVPVQVASQIAPNHTWGFTGVLRGTVKTITELGAGLVATGVGTLAGVALAPLVGGGVLLSAVVSTVTTSVLLQSKTIIDQVRAGESMFSIGKEFVVQTGGMLAGHLVGGQLGGVFVARVGSALAQQGVSHVLAATLGVDRGVQIAPTIPSEEQQPLQFQPPSLPAEAAELLQQVPEAEQASWLSRRARAITTMFTLGLLTTAAVINMPSIGHVASRLFANASWPNVVLRGLESDVAKQFASTLIAQSKPIQTVLGKIEGVIEHGISQAAEEKEGYIPLLLQQELFNVTLAEILKSVSRTTLQVGLQVGVRTGIDNAPAALQQLNQYRAQAAENVRAALASFRVGEENQIADQILQQNIEQQEAYLRGVFEPQSFEEKSSILEPEQEAVRQPRPVDPKVFAAFENPTSAINEELEQTLQRIGISMDHPAINPVTNEDVSELLDVLREFEQSRFHELGEVLPQTMSKHWFTAVELGVGTKYGMADLMYWTARQGAAWGAMLNGFGLGEDAAQAMHEFSKLPGVAEALGVPQFKVQDALLQAFLSTKNTKTVPGSIAAAVKGWMEVGLF